MSVKSSKLLVASVTIETDGPSDDEENEDCNNENYRELLEKHRVEFVKCLDLDRQFMLSYLRSHSVIDDEDCQLILNTGNSRQQKNAKFLDTISTRGYEAFQYFVNALEFEHMHLYNLVTGKKANVPDNEKDYKQWSDCDREYLARELEKLSEQYRSLTYLQSKTYNEKQQAEKKCLEITSNLNSAKIYLEELEFELQIKDEQEQGEEDQEICDVKTLFRHCQELAKENAEKSNTIIALQARLLAINEDIDRKIKIKEEIAFKNKTLMQQVKELTINYDFQRTESKRLRDSFNRTASEIRSNQTNERQVHTLKFELARLKEDYIDVKKEASEHEKTVRDLNAKLSLISEQKEMESEMRNEMSDEFLKVRHKLKMLELETDQSRSSLEFYKEKATRVTDEISLYQEQVAFLTRDLENTIKERNAALDDRVSMMKYNNEMIKSRDEAVETQLEIALKFEKRYKEALKQLEQTRQELDSLMLERLRESSTSEGKSKIDVFTKELEKSRATLRRQASIEESEIDVEDEDLRNRSKTGPADIDIKDRDRETSLYRVVNSFKTHMRRKSSPETYSTSSNQFSVLYESLMGNTVPFASLLQNPTVFPQYEEKQGYGSDQKSDGERRKTKRRISSSRRSNKKDRKKSLETVKALLGSPKFSPKLDRKK